MQHGANKQRCSTWTSWLFKKERKKETSLHLNKQIYSTSISRLFEEACLRLQDWPTFLPVNVELNLDHHHNLWHPEELSLASELLILITISRLPFYRWKPHHKHLELQVLLSTKVQYTALFLSNLNHRLVLHDSQHLVPCGLPGLSSSPLFCLEDVQLLPVVSVVSFDFKWTSLSLS